MPPAILFVLSILVAPVGPGLRAQAQPSGEATIVRVFFDDLPTGRLIAAGLEPIESKYEERVLGGGGHRRTASAPTTARAENRTCQHTRIVNDTCFTPRDPIRPGSRTGPGDSKDRDTQLPVLPNR